MRLDQWLVQTGKFKSRERAKEAIEKQLIKVSGRIISKPAFEVAEGMDVQLLQPDFDFVSRGGLKLAAALTEFAVPVKGLVTLDIGVATGGFTEALLKAGAEKVYAVDIGEGQLDPKILADSRVVFRNQTDARKLQPKDFSEQLDLIVIDVSFISITALLPALLRISGPATRIIVLIKPQFELGKAHSGVIKDQKIIQQILSKLSPAFVQSGLEILKEMPSPILGKEGNQEFLWLLKKLKQSFLQ
jgi:23S rRNA (cytidine1920-2'-O)/16S rRNA (cytidine1409-2'-O)-methyltransferase